MNCQLESKSYQCILYQICTKKEAKKWQIFGLTSTSIDSSYQFFLLYCGFSSAHLVSHTKIKQINGIGVDGEQKFRKSRAKNCGRFLLEMHLKSIN